MNPARRSEVGPLANTVQEVLMAMFAPDLRRRLLDEALALEGCAQIPSDPLRCRAFVEGPLRLVIKRRVGDVMASFLLETLIPIFEPTERAPLASELPAFGEDDEVETSSQNQQDTDVYDAASLRQLRRRLKQERPQSGARLRTALNRDADGEAN